VARIFLERRDMTDDLRRLFNLLDEASGPSGAAGECAPPFDVIETASTIEVIMDLPGVTAESVKILFARNTLMIGGHKLPGTCEHREAAFHLAERTFGRFARAIRVNGAFDAGRAEATLNAGELRIVLPRIEERRGAEIRIPVRAD
jgi:HSP20 family protein